MLKNLLLVLLVVSGSGLFAQLNLFQPHYLKSSDVNRFERRILPDVARYYEVSAPDLLAKALAKAPAEGSTAPQQELLLTLPDPEGKMATFRITRYQMITPELQAVYPSYVTAFGWDINAPHRRIFLDWTGLGFGATVTGGTEGRWHIEPVYWQQHQVYQSFYSKDYPRADRDESCGYEPDPELMAELEAFGLPDKAVGDCQLREYRLALACTGEYFNAVGGTQASVVTEMMRAINRVNEVFRSDLAIQLTIINLPTPSNGIQLVYSNPASDPYTNDDGDIMLDENQATVNSVIGAANYDIGHVFSTGGGGIASLASPCSSVKAQGVTGLPSPTGDPFYIDFVAHEIGHQFGGNHTFNSTEENCATRNASTAYEPGGGTTVQAYAGICGPLANIQLNSDPYYHAVSIQEISAYMELGGGSTCATVVSTANTAPTVSVGGNYTIPANTPFVLTATGNDVDGDALTYCWEQFDLGPILAGEPTGNEAMGPLFRSFPPTPSPERYFPNLPALVAGGGSPWEALPLVSRDMSFIVTLRDFGAAGYGCTVQDKADITVVNTGSQYAVTAPNGGEVWQSGSQQTVTWNVAGTTGNGINCSMVDIVLSTDGGLTFTQVLATVANSGSATITAPGITETNARIMVRCNGNIFFDISDGDFSIEQTDYIVQPITGVATTCNGGTSAVYSFTLQSLQGYTGTINYTASGLPGGASATFTPPSTTLTSGSSQTVSFTVNGLAATPPGNYTFQIITDDGGTPKSEDFFLTIFPDLAAPMLLTPADNGFLPLNAAVFDWEDVPNATTYRIDFYSDAAGTNSAGFLDNRVNSQVNFGSSFDASYNDGDMLFWKITAFNANCSPIASSESEIRKLTWGTMTSGNSLVAGNSPLIICSGEGASGDFTVSFFNGDLTGPATLTATSMPAGVSVTFTPSTLNDGQVSTVSLSGEETLAPGNYVITVQADDGSTTETINLMLEVQGDVNVTAPVSGQENLLQSVAAGSCTANGGMAIFVDFEFDAYTGPGTVTGYSLFVSRVGGGNFTPSSVTPGVTNTRGYCANPDDEFIFRIEAMLMDGSVVVSCTRNFFARTVLPVQWLSFNAHPEGKSAQLNWQVEQDENHIGFAVERSITSGSQWTQIGYVLRSENNGFATYNFTDATVTPGNAYLYRLRQEDADASFNYSVIRAVNFLADDDNVTAWPNPANDVLNLALGQGTPENLKYSLYNPVGQRIMSDKITAETTTIELGELPPGVYQIHVTDQHNYHQLIRVVKQ